MDPNVPVMDFQTKVFTWFAKNSKLIISLFHFAYWFGIVILVGLVFLESQANYFGYVYGLGKFFGQSAAFLLGIVVLPGILGRFRIEIKITRIITLFRRQLGITVFLLAFAHYSLIRFFPTLFGTLKFQIPYPTLFENLGALALFILFLMFVTSNDTSRKKLGQWWKILHRFVYAAIWILVLHVGLQKIGLWTIGIFVIALLESCSWIYFYIYKRRLNKTESAPTSAGNGSPSKYQTINDTNVS